MRGVLIIGIGRAIAVAALREAVTEFYDREAIGLRPDHVPRPEKDIANCAPFLTSGVPKPLYRFDASPRSIRQTLASKRPARRKKR